MCSKNIPPIHASSSSKRGCPFATLNAFGLPVSFFLLLTRCNGFKRHLSIKNSHFHLSFKTFVVKDSIVPRGNANSDDRRSNPRNGPENLDTLVRCRRYDSTKQRTILAEMVITTWLNFTSPSSDAHSWVHVSSREPFRL
jgi:hypothetical protein